MKRVLCYGDSNTWGYMPGLGTRFPADVRWTGVAASLLREQCILLEDGLNGRTTVFDDPYTGFRNGKKGLGYSLCSQAPIDLLVLCLGTNDLKFTNVIGAKKGLEELLRQIALDDACFDAAMIPIFTQGPKVLVISPIPLHPDIATLRPDSSMAGKYADSAQFARCYQAVAEARGMYYLDAAQYASASPVDCVHMDAQSHQRLGRAVAEKIRGILAEL